MTYAELVQKIRDYTEVSSNVLTNTIIDGFINDSEFKILRELGLTIEIENDPTPALYAEWLGLAIFE